MQLYPLKLVTVVGETVIMREIADEGIKFGATGFTMMDVEGHGSRSTRNVMLVTGEAKTRKLEFVVPGDIAVAILAYVSHNYFDHYACIAWLSDVSVVRGEQYLGHKNG
ncbi:MAG: transcriptional regulator [Planctomycetota bacterium]|nr:MAG: transcriptional regulator [Planctomycetota bacterium]